MDTIFNRLLPRFSSVNAPIPDTQRIKTLQKAVDLSQVAGTYTLFTCNATGGVIILDAQIYCSVVGATFTSDSIQTNDTTPVVIMSSTEGAVANLTAGKNIAKAFTGPSYLAASKLVTHTITGSQGTGTLLLTLRYMSAVAGADIS